MSERRNPAVHTPTRRQMIGWTAVALGSVAAGSEVWARARQQTAKETTGSAANRTRTSLHQEITFKGSPQRIYEVLLDSKQFAAFTGMPAEIDAKAGGAFSMFGGLIVGRNVELVPAQRVVQAWRPTHWEPGVYSLVKFDLKPRDSETIVDLDHTGFAAGAFDDLDHGWYVRYWDPLKKFLA